MKKFMKFTSLVVLLLTIVNVIPVQANEEKVIYLTFDDAPGGKITSEILDILKDEQVPATFFVIGDQIATQEDLILRMKNEGHSIGLHSYTHVACNLYQKPGGFLKEMKQVQAELEKVTGEKYYILRFPFGCNNNYSKLSQTLVDELHAENFRIYDWNVDSQDGANPKQSASFFIKNATSTKPYITLLMHCTRAHKNSPKALRPLIKYYKSQGYTFKKIENDTPELYRIKRK